ncbi:MAG TPA: chemotaxis protein CheW [bacterium]|nr:chemotaxis protein CheW [bacterium]
MNATQKRRILTERAKELALPVIEKKTDDSHVEVLEFLLSYEKYAMESRYVNEVFSMADFTHLPCTPDFVVGIMNLRGTILSLIDIRSFCDLPVQGLSNLNRVIVVENGQMKVGILADVILGIRQIPSASIQPPLSTMKGIRSDYLKGVTKEPLVIIDIQKILSDPQLIVDEEIDV